jgi:hypothetical protein
MALSRTGYPGPVTGHSGAGRFFLSKWYMDCVAPNGDVAIAYWGRARFGTLKLSYASVLSRHHGRPVRVTSTIRPTQAPTFHNDQLTWKSSPLKLRGQWTAGGKAHTQTLLATAQGRVRWRCLQHRAQAEIHLPGGVIRGAGYTEHLIVSIPPWQLPIHELRWGRFVGAKHSLVWVDWRGPAPLQIVLLDGKAQRPSKIGEGDEVLRADYASLRVSEPAVLRKGRLGKTALSFLSRTLPTRMLATQETKWCGRGSLSTPAGSDSGWVIFEVVRWPTP